MYITKVESWVFRAPIQAPVRTSFGVTDNRPAVFVRISAADGVWGWGEVFCNFPSVGAEHRARLVDSLFAPLLQGRPTADVTGLQRTLEAQTRPVAIQCGEPGPFAQIIGAVDQALWGMADQVRGSVAPLCIELELHLAGGIELHPLVGQRRPRDVAAQLLQPLAVMCLDTHGSVQAEPVDVGAQGAGALRSRAASRR